MKFGFDKNSPDCGSAKSSVNLTYPPIAGKAGTLDDFMSSIKKLNLKDGDSVVFYITAHGGSPSDPDKPETATISGWNSDVTFEDFGKALATLPKSVKVKLITTT